MTFKKPDNVRYTDMCIYIDSAIPNNTYDEALVYEYLYHLVNMMAHKLGFFDLAADYDQFSLYLATVLYNRLTNKNKEPIKSILNYIKKIIGLRKITYEKEFIKDSICNNDYIYYFSNDDLADNLIDQTTLYDHLSFDIKLEGIDQIISDHLRKIPYKYNSSEWHNIYVSVLLTLLNSITPTQAQQLKIENTIDSQKVIVCTTIYRELRTEKPILYHLDDSMSTYIKVLCTEIKHAICAELNEEMGEHSSPESILKNLLIASYSENNPNEY